MFEKICRYIEEKKMIEYGDSIVIGLSGGADSVCLFRILLRLKEIYGLTLYAVHINHGIRGEEANEDALFCSELAKEYDVPIRLAIHNIPELAVSMKMTEEEAGRIIRYREFEDELFRRSADKIAVAHHLNDQAETVLFRMCRGTGIKGMMGIPHSRDRIIRPLLCATKDEIIQYLKMINQDYREDSTNSDSDYDRNRIRNIIIPELLKINGKTVQHIGALSEQLADIYEWYDNSIREYYEKNVVCALGLTDTAYRSDWIRESDETDETCTLSISTDCICTIQKIAASEIIRRMIGELSRSMKDIEQRHIDMIYELCKGGTGKSVSLPYGLTAEIEYGNLRITKDSGKTDDDNEYVMIISPAKEGMELIPDTGVYLPDEKKYCNGPVLTCTLLENNVSHDEVPKNNCTKWFDYGKINTKLVLRKYRPDDYIYISKDNKKKLSRYVIDNKIPRRYRDSIYVIADGDHVLWIIGGRSSMGYYVSEATTKVLQINVDCDRRCAYVRED